MADFIAALGKDRYRNWEVCKREQLWGMVASGSNWRSNGRRVQRGDRIFIWRSGHGFIAQLEAQGPMRLTAEPGVPVPWDEPNLFGGVVDIRVVTELATPIGDSFPNANGRVGLRFGFNNTALQHVFEEVSPDVGARIQAAFRAQQTESLGVPFESGPAPGPVSAAQPFDVDPDAVDRGLLAHYRTLEALAEWVGARGWRPRLPARGEPLYDLSWQDDDEVVHVAEVKSTTEENREKQLRLGLGQVLRYRHALAASGREVQAWLVTEDPVRDDTWNPVCAAVGVRLTSPVELPSLIL
ncbi:hypothetical protein [Modestobacter sp. URMC 112]